MNEGRMVEEWSKGLVKSLIVTYRKIPYGVNFTKVP